MHKEKLEIQISDSLSNRCWLPPCVYLSDFPQIFHDIIIWWISDYFSGCGYSCDSVWKSYKGYPKNLCQIQGTIFCRGFMKSIEGDRVWVVKVSLQLAEKNSLCDEMSAYLPTEFV